jgi:hypothetical protein
VQIFLSYRRTDVGGHAGRLTDALTRRLGAKSVFQDVTAIAPGQEFTVAIDRALDACDAVLAVIGPGWLTATTPQGNRRLTDPDDYVRIELARALARKARVIPVLAGGSSLPAAADLPDDLQGLVRRQGVVLHDETWHSDVDGLVRSLRGEPAVPDRRGRRRLAVGVAVLVLTAAGAVAWQLRPGPAALPHCAAPSGPGWTRVPLSRNPSGTVKVQGGSLTVKVRTASWKALETAKWQVTLTTEMTNNTATQWYHGAYRYQYLAVGRRENAATCFDTRPDLVEPRKVGDATIGFQVACKPTGYLELGLNGDDANVGAIDVTPATSSPEC